jgi:hypothetical protein
MAAPLLKEDKTKIANYLRQQDLSDLTSVRIKEQVKVHLGIDISQPTASKFKREILEDNSDDLVSTEEDDAMIEPTNPDKIRQLSQEQLNSIEHILQGKSDRAVAEAVGVSRQMIWDWKNSDPLFIAELNRQRVELWKEARERMKSLANRALDILELQLNSGDPKASLAAAKYVLQGTKLLGDTDLSIRGPMTPEEALLITLRKEARKELMEKTDLKKSGDPLDDLYEIKVINEEAEVLAQSRLKKAMAEAGLA